MKPLLGYLVIVVGVMLTLSYIVALVVHMINEKLNMVVNSH